MSRINCIDDLCQYIHLWDVNGERTHNIPWPPILVSTDPKEAECRGTIIYRKEKNTVQIDVKRRNRVRSRTPITVVAGCAGIITVVEGGRPVAVVEGCISITVMGGSPW